LSSLLADGYSRWVVHVEEVEQRLLALGDFADMHGALHAQIAFLDERASMMLADAADPMGVLRSMEHEVTETLHPRMMVEQGLPNPEPFWLDGLAAESADVVVFGLSALIAKGDWGDGELQLIGDSLQYAQELAELGGFDLNEVTVWKITKVNPKHYPVEMFEEGMPYRMSRRVCRALRTYFGIHFWDNLGRNQVGIFLQTVVYSSDESDINTWGVQDRLGRDEYAKLHEAALELQPWFEELV
jgi:hypothetical protein